MEIISKAYEPVLQILKRFQKRSPEGRMMKYCIHQQVEEGVLLFNLLTRELLLLTEDEYGNPAALEYLWERWFVVPVETNERELVDFARLVLSAHHKKSKSITDYIIYTTTDCNARCFYCFQHGTARIPMTQETAEKVLNYIVEHCDRERVRLQWFGGEPLLNPDVIDTICTGLRRAGVAFDSYLVTNGYLLDDAMVRRAMESWNLHSVQITLDGTEKIYNRSKAYVNTQGSPYQIVLSNMERVINAGANLYVRLNLDLYNAQDLLQLVDCLGERFGGQKGVYVYAHHLFNGVESSAQFHTQEGWEEREQALMGVVERIDRWNMTAKHTIRKKLPINACRADSDRGVVITPGGHIGACDHYPDSEFIGHVDRAEFDPEMVAAWREKVPAIPECVDCVHYPDCLLLKKCPENKCFPQLRMKFLRDKERRMRNEYEMWKNHETPMEEDGLDLDD